MFESALAKATQDLQALVECLRIHAGTRKLVQFVRSNPDGDHADEIVALAKGAPGRVDWQLHDHCAAFTRAYAIYENFVFDLVCDWLACVPRLYGAYERLPTKLLDQHRTGTGSTLQAWREKRGLPTIEIIAQSLWSATTGNEYQLQPVAFLLRGSNLRPDQLTKQFAVVGLPDPMHFIQGNPLIAAFIEDQWGDATTVRSEMQRIVELRNEAAHGPVSEVVGLDETERIMGLLKIVFSALRECAMHCATAVLESEGQAYDLGVVSHRFSFGVNGLKASGARIAAGDEVIVQGAHSCGFTPIHSIEVEHREFKVVNPSKDMQVGLKLREPAPVGSRLIRRAWEFYLDKAGLWRWRHRRADGKNISQSSRGWPQRSDCETNAKKRGWRG
jgi:uncharacterized protein YegP (UPF0339 family)